ncbi:MAG: DNRLRE domain-containing protein [Bacteroidales bacterium]|nr:DNRLRE domain-containing protein [Bacteroidales bacterium]
MKTIIVFSVLLLSVFLLQAQVTLVIRLDSTGKDANIRTDKPIMNYGNSMDFIANAFTAGGNFFIQRSLMEFDLSVIPVTAVINSAYLNLYCNTISGHAQYQYGDNLCYLKRITGSWGETQVNWNNQPSTTTENQVTLAVSTSNTQDYPSVDVKQLIQDIRNYPQTSHGIMIQLQIEETYRTMVFGSGDHPDPLKRPVLIIQYDTCQSGQLSTSFSYNESSGSTIDFTDQSIGASTWYWDFGDGQTSEIQNPQHTYANAGKYNVCLTTGNPCESDSLCQEVEVCASVTPSFEYTINNHQSVLFQDASVNAEHWFWDFGDGSSSTDQNPEHAYSNSGDFQVVEYVWNSCDSASISDLVTICIPVATDFSYADLGNASIQFTDLSADAISWLWDFGDGNVSTAQNPLHQFLSTGSFSVCLKAQNTCSSEMKCQRVAVELLLKTNANVPVVIYPGSGENDIRLLLPDSIGQPGIWIHDTSGHLVYQEDLTAGSTEFKLPALDEGIYIVAVRTEEKNFTLKILVH